MILRALCHCFCITNVRSIHPDGLSDIYKWDTDALDPWEIACCLGNSARTLVHGTDLLRWRWFSFPKFYLMIARLKHKNIKINNIFFQTLLYIKNKAQPPFKAWPCHSRSLYTMCSSEVSLWHDLTNSSSSPPVQGTKTCWRAIQNHMET